MRTILIPLIAAWALVAPAMAADYVVDQKDMTFLPAEITVAVGDKIKFTNNDRTAHQVWTKDNGVNLSTPMLKPGEAHEFKFAKAGTYTVKCQIHPKMKLVVTVK
jgi:plastocyanin